MTETVDGVDPLVTLALVAVRNQDVLDVRDPVRSALTPREWKVLT
jgi:hypothetical protein